MVIRRSSATRIETLVADLSAASAATREAAIARLTILGARAVDRLAALVDSDAGPVARVAAFQVLESVADPRAIDRALSAINGPDAGVASAGVSLARAFLHGPRSAAIVERLAAVALDPTRDEGVRLNALEALGDLKPATAAPIFDALKNDPSDRVRLAAGLAVSVRRDAARDPAAEVSRAADGALPEDPAGLRRAVTLAGSRVALAPLLRVIERIREREASEEGARRAEWTRARGAAHVALAGRGSRIAVYDLRESIEAASAPLPVEFLAALSTIGDASCLEGLAAAYARSMHAGHTQRDWWQQHLASTFRAIAKRCRVTRRHATLKKIEKRWPEAFTEIV